MAINAYPFAGGSTSQDEFSWLFRELGSGVGAPYDTSFKVTADGSGMVASVAAGFAIVRGHAARMASADTVTFDAPSSQNRIDVVTLRLNPTAKTITLNVVKGTPAASPTVPTLQETDTGLYDLPLAHVLIRSDLNHVPASSVTDVRKATGSRVSAHDSTIPAVGSGAVSIGYNRSTGRWQEAIGSTVRDLRIDASQVYSGTLSADRIPNLSASKITAGTLGVDRIPSLSASKITSGTLSADRIPNLSASKITAGTLSPDRIPSIPATHIVGVLSASRGGTGTENVYKTPGSGSAKQVYVMGSGVLFSVTSARKYKADIEPITDTRILELEPVSFRQKGSASTHREDGVIADQAHELGLTNIVVYDDEGEIESIDYSRLSVHLLVALRQLAARVAELEGRAA